MIISDIQREKKNVVSIGNLSDGVQNRFKANCVNCVKKSNFRGIGNRVIFELFFEIDWWLQRQAFFFFHNMHNESDSKSREVH